MQNWTFWDACRQWHWDLRWSSLRGNEVEYWVGENATLGVSGRMRTVALGHSVDSLWGHEAL
eukprot:5622088-Pyramimonas_sp.AAC.1